LAYLALLDRVLEDRELSADEVAALGQVAEDWGISVAAATRLHLAYLTAVWRLARADGVVTKAEHDDLETIADLLGVPFEPVDDAAAAATAVLGAVGTDTPTSSRSGAIETDSAFVGRSVCFTGESVCSLGGKPLSRDDQERLATAAGMVVKGNVSSRLDLLVLADPASTSGKARKAAELGIRRMAELAFWRALGVPVD
jgi:DNA polymerase-3 subunit epsilon